VSITIWKRRSWAALAMLVLAAGLVAPAGVTARQGDRPSSTGASAAGSAHIQSGLVTKAKQRGAVRVIVNLRGGVTATELRRASARVSFSRGNKARAVRVARFTRSTGGKVARRYRYLPAIVVYATPRTLARLKVSPDVASVVADRLNKPSLNWNVPLVQANAMNTAGWGGTNQIVAVLDTGVDASHPLLTGKVVDEACFASGAGIPGSGDCPNGLPTQLHDPGAAANCHWAEDCLHGTHVAGIAVGRYLSATKTRPSIAGVARNADLLPVQIFSRAGSGIGAWDSDMAAGLEWVYQQELSHAYGAKHVASVNLSVGGDLTDEPCDSDLIEKPFMDAANLLRTLGIATVVAAGNDGYNNATSYPGCLTTVITVASTTKSDQFSYFTNLAWWVDLAAPGSDIYSSVPGGYDVLSGTSMAAPHVAGAWAEIKSRFPSASVNIVSQALRATGKSVSYAGITKKRIKILDAGDWLGATTTGLSRKPSSSKVNAGTSITLTATVTRQRDAGLFPTGKVSFRVAGVTVATKTIDPVTGIATATVTVTGHHGDKINLQAFYKGAGPFVASHSSVVTVTIK
jgi:subtilisin family serine protease